jgi:hypothetical protein
MHEGWTVTIEAAGTDPAGTDPADLTTFPDAIDALVDGLHDHGGAVSSSTDSTRYGATFTWNAPAIRQAALLGHMNDAADETAHDALHYFRAAAERAGLPAWPIVRLEVVTWSEMDAELEQPTIPELVGVGEIAEIIGVTQQRASKLARRPDFPEPVARLRSGPVWARPSLNRFVADWDRKPGRPSSLTDAERAELERLRAQLDTTADA